MTRPRGSARDLAAVLRAVQGLPMGAEVARDMAKHAQKGAERPNLLADGEARYSESSGRIQIPLRLAFTAPYPPSTNTLYATVRGRRVKTIAAQEYAEHIELRVLIALAYGGRVPPPPYRLLLTAYPPDGRRRDVSNLIKCLEDALFAAIGEDDCTVTYLLAIKRPVDRANPRVDVVLETDR